MPTWLDGKTIAMVTTTITAALALGTMIQTAHSGLRGEIENVRNEIENVRTELGNDIQNLRTELSNDIRNLRTELSNDIRNVRTELGNDINKLDDRLRSVELGLATIQTTMAGFDAPLRVVERRAHHAADAPAPDG